MVNHYSDHMTMREWYKGKIINGLLSALNGAIIKPEDQKRLVVICGNLADEMLLEDEQYNKKQNNA